MAFEVKKGERPIGKKSALSRTGEASNQRAETPPALTAVPALVSSEASKQDDDDKPPEPPKKGGRPTLTRIK